MQYGFVQAVDIEAIDMGTRPLSVGGVKVCFSEFWDYYRAD